MSLIFNNLMLEITRKCNMSCKHCMRGEQQDVTMESDIIKKVIKSTAEIDCLSITGGEPSLAPNAISWLVYYLKNSGVRLGSFFCATNAAVYSEEFVKQLNDLYSICTKKQNCILTISRDQFHSQMDEKAYEEYRKLLYYSAEKEKTFLYEGSILNEGRAKENGIGAFSIPTEKYINNYGFRGFNIYVGDRIYVNALGYVFLNADLSYKSQAENSIGNVCDLSLEAILKKKFYTIPDIYFSSEYEYIYCIHISAEEDTFFSEAIEDRKYYKYPNAVLADYRNLLNNINLTPVNTEHGRPLGLKLDYKELPITDTRCDGAEIIYLRKDKKPKKVIVEILKYPLQENEYVR